MATQGVQQRDPNAALRVSKALELLKQRLTYDEIAKRCGYADRGSAYKAIQRELNRRIVPKIDDYRKQELDILDEIHRRVWKEAFRGEGEEGDTNLWAVDRLLKISEARRELLNLDLKPEEVAANVVVIREVPAGYLGAKSEVVDGS